MSTPSKKYPTLGCCGLDCGLCPRHYTTGESRCPGCNGEGFAQKHPSCSILTCCYKKQGLECCGECEKYPCDKIKPWGSGDSFISHQVCLANLDWIKQHGTEAFIKNQQKRIELLQRMITELDDGRSKGFFCLAASLLPPEKIDEAIKEATYVSLEKPARTKQFKQLLNDIARSNGIALILRK